LLAFGKFPWKSVVDVHEQITDQFDSDGDPEDKTEKSSPKLASSSVTEVIVVIYMMMAANSNDLP
jgi:hypothetical protein